jgi:hypothetical protein
MSGDIQLQACFYTLEFQGYGLTGECRGNWCQARVIFLKQNSVSKLRPNPTIKILCACFCILSVLGTFLFHPFWQGFLKSPGKISCKPILFLIDFADSWFLGWEDMAREDVFYNGWAGEDRLAGREGRVAAWVRQQRNKAATCSPKACHTALCKCSWA